MLTRAYREQLAFERRIGILLVLGAVATVAWAHWLLAVLHGPFKTGSLCLLFGLLAFVFSLSSLLRARPAPLYPLFDRPVPRTGALDDAPRTACNQALTDAGAELDALATRLGVTPLSTFVHVEVLRPGVARHAPEEALATLDAVLPTLTAQGLAGVPAGPVLDGLRELRADLAAASAVGARFCLRPTPVWSTAAGRRLQLHLGTVLPR